VAEVGGQAKVVGRVGLVKRVPAVADQCWCLRVEASKPPAFAPAHSGERARWRRGEQHVGGWPASDRPSRDEFIGLSS
jgi:hypothetical protein